MATATGQPMTAVVEEALDALERRHFFAGFNQRYAELKGDAGAWTEVEAERGIESRSIRDRGR